MASGKNLDFSKPALPPVAWDWLCLLWECREELTGPSPTSSESWLTAGCLFSRCLWVTRCVSLPLPNFTSKQVGYSLGFYTLSVVRWVDLRQLHDNSAWLSSLWLDSHYCFGYGSAVYGVSVPRPGVEPRPSAVKVCSPHHWTVREFPNLILIEKWRTGHSKVYSDNTGFRIEYVSNFLELDKCRTLAEWKRLSQSVCKSSIFVQQHPVRSVVLNWYTIFLNWFNHMGKAVVIKLSHIVSDLKSESLSDSVYYMRSMDIVYFVFVFRVCRRAGLTNLVWPLCVLFSS